MRRGLAALLAALALHGPVARGECVAPGVHAMVVPFKPARDEDAAIGRNVGALLALQVLVAMRRAPAGGVSVWEPRIDLPAIDPAVVERAARARARPPQLVLWGTVQPYGKWTIVHPRLTVLPDAPIAAADGDLCTRRQDEVWTLALPDGGALTLGLPRRDYTFRPLTLSAALATRYAAPDALHLYSRRDGQGGLVGDLGLVGDSFTVRRRVEGAIEVEAGGKVGWVDVSGLDAEGGDALVFTAGLLALMRGDNAGAEAALATVSREAAVSLRADALLLRALAALHAGQPAGALIEEAARLDPYSAAVARMFLVDRLHAWLTKRRPAAELAALRALADARRYLLPADEPVLRVIDGLRPSPDRVPGRVPGYGP